MTGEWQRLGRMRSLRDRFPDGRSRPASDRSPAVMSSNFGLLRHLKSVVDLDAKIPIYDHSGRLRQVVVLLERFKR